MRYRIKRIDSKEKRRERIMLVACVMLYFLCYAISMQYADMTFPEWVVNTIK